MCVYDMFMIYQHRCHCQMIPLTINCERKRISKRSAWDSERPVSTPRKICSPSLAVLCDRQVPPFYRRFYWLHDVVDWWISISFRIARGNFVLGTTSKRKQILTGSLVHPPESLTKRRPRRLLYQWTNAEKTALWLGVRWLRDSWCSS